MCFDIGKDFINFFPWNNMTYIIKRYNNFFFKSNENNRETKYSLFYLQEFKG